MSGKVGAKGALAARNILTRRHALGLSLAELAERLSSQGTPMLKSTLSKVENFDRRVDIDDLFAIAEALNCTATHLLAERCETCLDDPPRGLKCLTCEKAGP